MSPRFLLPALALAALAVITPADAATDHTGPSVAFVTPASGAIVSGTVTIEVSASDPSSVQKVRVWFNEYYLGFDTTAPYTRSWNTTTIANGIYTLKAEALDKFNNSTIKTIRVTVINPDTTPPSITLTAPADGATVSGTVAITATAADNKGLQKVRFWAGSTYLGFDATAPFGMNWNTTGVANGPYIIKAQAVDWANNTADAAPRTVTVSNAAASATPPPASTNTPGPTLTNTPAPTRTPTPTATRTSTPVSTPTPPQGSTTLGGCPVFPADNPWNTDISNAPVHSNSANYIANIGLSGNGFLHADFGGGGDYGIPFLVVPPSQPGVPVTFIDYGDESDPGPYPIPLSAAIEGGSDRHTLALQQQTCKLYELFGAAPVGSHWEASSGAIFDLTSNALRPEGWTSADAAGLPILPGLARYDEVQSGVITHALRVTVGQTQKGYIHPATHWASSSTDPNRPPMGLRLRLKANYDISAYQGEARVILEALKKYGLIVADNGTSWYITGAMDARWDDNDLNQLKTVPGSAFEAVNTGPIITP